MAALKEYQGLISPRDFYSVVRRIAGLSGRLWWDLSSIQAEMPPLQYGSYSPFKTQDKCHSLKNLPKIEQNPLPSSPLSVSKWPLSPFVSSVQDGEHTEMSNGHCMNKCGNELSPESGVLAKRQPQHSCWPALGSSPRQRGVWVLCRKSTVGLRSLLQVQKLQHQSPSEAWPLNRVFSLFCWLGCMVHCKKVLRKWWNNGLCLRRALGAQLSRGQGQVSLSCPGYIWNTLDTQEGWLHRIWSVELSSWTHTLFITVDIQCKYFHHC